MAPHIKLYILPTSCSAAAHILLEDSGLKYEYEIANFKNPAYRAEYLRKINAKGQVPALAIDGEIITEAPAVITTVAQLIPSKEYAGSSKSTVRFLEWMNFLSGTVHSKYFNGIFRPSIFTDDPAAEAGVKEKSIKNVLYSFGLIEEKLTGVYALDEHLTGVDVYLFYFVKSAEKLGFWDGKAFPKYNKLYENMLTLPAVKTIWQKHLELLPK